MSQSLAFVLESVIFSDSNNFCEIFCILRSLYSDCFPENFAVSLERY